MTPWISAGYLIIYPYLHHPLHCLRRLHRRWIRRPVRSPSDRWTLHPLWQSPGLREMALAPEQATGWEPNQAQEPPAWLPLIGIYPSISKRKSHWNSLCQGKFRVMHKHCATNTRQTETAVVYFTPIQSPMKILLLREDQRVHNPLSCHRKGQNSRCPF